MERNPEQEADVVLSLKKHLVANGLAGRSVETVLVDAHPSNVSSRHRSQLEPIARVSIGGAFPDILCSLAGTGSQLVAGIEAKPTPGQWVKGISQERRYRDGVHISYFAAPGPFSGEAMAMTRDVIGALGSATSSSADNIARSVPQGRFERQA
jgi:hypothetical protein